MEDHSEWFRREQNSWWGNLNLTTKICFVVFFTLFFGILVFVCSLICCPGTCTNWCNGGRHYCYDAAYYDETADNTCPLGDDCPGWGQIPGKIKKKKEDPVKNA